MAQRQHPHSTIESLCEDIESGCVTESDWADRLHAHLRLLNDAAHLKIKVRISAVQPAIEASCDPSSMHFTVKSSSGVEILYTSKRGGNDGSMD